MAPLPLICNDDDKYDDLVRLSSKQRSNNNNIDGDRSHQQTKTSIITSSSISSAPAASIERFPLSSFEQHYIVGKEIGSGKFAIVKHCICLESNKELAAKFIRKSRFGRIGQKLEDIELEIAILSYLDHPNIIKLLKVFEDNHQVVLVFELMKGGELQDYIAEKEYLDEDEAKFFLKQILQALVYLHERFIVHLDLKPENILLSDLNDRRIKIIDYGISKRVDINENIKGIYGTPEFIAPEIINYEPIGFGTDLWAIGCIAYNMLWGVSPFFEEEKQDIYTRITLVDYNLDLETDNRISSTAKDFIRKLLIKDLRKRMTAKQCLEHSWLSSTDPSIPNPSIKLTDSKLNGLSKVTSESIRKRWQRSIYIVILHLRHSKRKLTLPIMLTNGDSLKTNLVHSNNHNHSNRHNPNRIIMKPSLIVPISITNRKQNHSMINLSSMPSIRLRTFSRSSSLSLSSNSTSSSTDSGKRFKSDSNNHRSSLSDGSIFYNSAQDENFMLTALFGAIEEGNLQFIQELFVTSNIDPNQCNKHGESLLHYCAGLGQLDIFKFLCKIGADINAIDDQGDTVVHWAARQNHSNIIRHIYEQTISIEMFNKNNETPLHVAARYGHVEAVEQLCKCGANINAIDEHGETAILIAVWHGFPKIVHILGEIGADTNMMNKEEETALHVASARGHYECVRCLLDSGADANLPNKNSYTPLHLALKRQHSLVAILLLKAGADYELADDNGERAIHYAARFNLISIAQWLCQSNRCQVNVPNKHGLYPLHIAAKSGHIEIVRTLCLAGSVVDQKDQDSIIPQICAIAQSHNDVADLLTRLRNERQKEEFIGQLMPINDQRLNRIKLKIFGHCGSGKSTLIESMKCGYFSSWFRRSKTTTNSTFLRKPFAAANGSSIIDPISARNISLNNINNKNVDRNQNPMIQNGQSCQNLSALSKTSTNLKTSSNTTNANFSSPTTTMSFKTTEPSIHGPVSIRQSQTKGIDCQQAYISNVGDLSIWEFSGHPCYHQIYDHFIGDSHCLHAIVFRLCDPVQIQLDGIFYWLYFIQSRTPIQEPLLFCGKSQQPAKVILIATHADIAQQFRTTDEIQNDLRLVMNKVDSVFKNVFDLHGQIFMIDANNAGSIEMKQLKQYLSQAKQTIVQDLPPTTGFLDSVLTFLNLFRKVSPNFPVLSLNQFKDMIRSQINPLSSDDHFKELVQQLETMGEIIFLKQTILTDCDLLVLNPKWLNCDIVGTLMMMKEDPNYLINLSKTRIMGIYSIDEFQEKFPDVDALDLLQLLESLSICAQNDRSGDIEYEFPYFNFSGDLEEILDQFQFKDNCSYHGIVYHCDRSLDRFYGSLLTCLFTRIQTNLSNELRKHPTFNVYDLHNCLKFSYFSHDDGRLMAIFSYNSSAQSIEIRFCGPIENRSDCFFFMQEMTNIVEQTLAKCMPGLTILKSYLSPSQLKTQRKNLSLYSSSALMRTLLMSSASNSKNIANSLLKKKVASDDGLIEERIGDIICFGILNLTEINQTSGEPTLANELHSSNLSLLTKQKLCSLLDPPESIGRDWCMFGILLGMTDKLPKLDPGANAQLSPTSRVIEECVRNVNCTIKNLVEKLTELNRFDCVNVILQTGPLLRMFPLSSLPEEGIIYNDESSHTSLGVSTLSQTSSSNLSH